MHPPSLLVWAVFPVALAVWMYGAYSQWRYVTRIWSVHGVREVRFFVRGASPPPQADVETRLWLKRSYAAVGVFFAWVAMLAVAHSLQAR